MKYCRKERYILLTVLVLFPFFSLLAQNSLKELKKKQELLAREIKESTRILKQTEKKRKNTVNQLYILNRQIKNRQRLINGYEQEIALIGKEIVKNRSRMDSINRRMDVLKKEYAQIITKYYELYKGKGGIIAYVFASESLNQAYRRIKYYQQFISYGKKLYDDLEKLIKELEKEVSKLEENRKERENTLAEIRKEQQKLIREKRRKNRYVQNLKKKEKEIRKNIRLKQRIKRKLSDEMQRIIAEERKKRKKGIALTPEEKIIAGNFNRNKGKLPWPTTKGVIIDDYGEHPHPVLKNITVKNDGVDIMTEKGSVARAVFEGEVRKIIAIPGANETVILKHGNYYTVYQNVYKVRVKTGDQVKLKQPLGTVFTDPKTGETILHFEIWSGMAKMNPETWLAKQK